MESDLTIAELVARLRLRAEYEASECHHGCEQDLLDAAALIERLQTEFAKTHIGQSAGRMK